MNSSDSIELIGTPNVDNEQLLTSGLFSTSVLEGDGGDVFVETGRLIIRDGAQIAAAAERRSTGAGGNITVTASDLVELSGTRPNGIPGGLYTFASRESSGDAGNLTVNTGRFIVRDGASVASSTDSTGNAGDLEINASESMEVINAEVRATTTLNANDAGDAGNFLINTNQLIVRDDGLVSASTSGSGDAGTLDINTNRLVVRDGARVSADTSSTGEAGKLTVNATEFVQVIGTSADGQMSSSLFLDSTGSGNAGGLEINTGTLIVEEGGQVSANTSNQGQAGNLMVNADSVRVIGTSANGESSSLLFDTSGEGNAGDLTITTGQLLVRDGGLVSAKTTDQGQAGTLEVNADSVQVIGTSANGENSSSLLFDSSGSGNA
ncbi:MAG: hypothetical protein RLP02_32110, partial [Coleofasciculus sp. C2-GNP5-27]